MSVSHRAMIFTLLGQQDLTSTQRSVGMVLMLRTDARHVGPWKRISWRLIGSLTGLAPDMCEEAFNKLCDKGWFDVQTHEDGRTRYTIPRARLAQAAAYRDEHRAKQKERAEKRAEAP